MRYEVSFKAEFGQASTIVEAEDVDIHVEELLKIADYNFTDDDERSVARIPFNHVFYINKK